MKRKLVEKILILFIPIYILSGICVLIDPYFHFHKPIDGISYFIDDERYQNDGIIRHFEYDAIIAGTSLEQNVKTSEVDRLFNVKSIKTTYPGSNFPEITAGLKQAYRTGHTPKIVMMSLGHNQCDADKDYWGHEDFDYPYYLYDDNIFNDYKYIFNLTVLGFVVKDVINTIKGIPTTNFDEYGNWNYAHSFGRESVLNTYKRPEVSSLKQLTEEDRDNIKENILENIVSLARENKTTTFYLYFPPYSTVYWDEKIRVGEFNKVLEVVKTSIEEMINEDNIKLFYFSVDTKITANLDNYKDYVHYGEWINSYMIEMMSKDRNLITKANYMDYLNKTKEFYANYNYESLFNQ